ncbi:RkpR, polysaccharide export protein [uncultured Roseibium sp.]|uniref:RkpR, polysaccharide export protein n=1 Tax=uncultured Roseibium sp. TaxID=1936171 RepID=UPI00262658F5|nr:RkpR, polysaccharide export protein [uncultured Roseibium sp.]
MVSTQDAPGEKNNNAKGAVYTLPQKHVADASRPVSKDASLVTRLRKAGLDPQKLLDLALPSSTSKSVTKLRHRLIIIGFLTLVALPSAAFTAYMFLWASDQYHSIAAFAVRSSEPVAATEILGMVLGGSGADSTTSNSYIVSDYLQSQAILEDLPNSINIDQIFNHSPHDILFRMGTDLPIEEKLTYWQSMVDVSYDSTSGVIYLEVRTFRPEDSVTITNSIIERSEILVNKLSETNRRQTVRYAEEAVAKAEARLKAIRKQMLAYRNETQEVSPEDNARLAAEMIAGLDQDRIVKETERTTLLTYLSPDSPRIRILDQQILALQSQIADVRKRMGSGVTALSKSPTDIPAAGSRAALSFRIADYEELALEEKFSQQLYITSLAGLESARQEADAKSLYLATFIKPTLSESAQYPNRLLYSLAFLLMLGGVWAICVLMYYNIRDRT